AALQVSERNWKFRLESSDEIAARGCGRIGRAWAANEDDAGGEGVGTRTDHSIAQFSSHWPGTGDRESGLDDGPQEGIPARIRRTVSPVIFGLLKGVVDSDRERRMCLFGESVHRLRHA